MHIKRALLAAAVTIGLTILAVGSATAAQAQAPVTFGANHVVDQAGVLGSKAAEVESASATLESQHNVKLYVAFVDTFTSPSDARTWANTTARQNKLTPNDYLLAVSVNGRSYYLSADTAGPVSQSQLTDIERNQIEPQLRGGNWSGAALAASTGLGAALSGGNGGGTGANGAPAASSSGAVTGVTVALLIILAIVIGILVLIFVRARRRRQEAVAGPAAPAAPVDELQAMPLPDLERRAGSALVGTDDALQASTQELGFAVAQYGEEASRPFAAAVGAAQGKLREAFALKQKLDDAVPDTDDERREWNTTIIHNCADANSLLDQQAAAFAELRSLAKDVPGKVAELRSAVAAQAGRVTTTTTTLAELITEYTDAAMATVRDNGPQATERLTFASTALADAEAKATAGSTSPAAVSLRAAEAALDQAGLLLDAVDRVGADLQTARGHIDALIANLQQDIVDARALAAAGDPTGAIMAAQTSTQAAVTDVTSRLNGGQVNPRDLLQKLELANRDIDGVLGAVRSRQAQEHRAAASLGQVLGSAQSRVSAATDFIAARRGAVGAEARTRLAEASRVLSLAQAAQATDAVSAVEQAQRADELAAQAIQLAETDVNGFASTSGMGGMFGYPGQRGRGGGGGIIGAVLGGILIDSVLRGGGGGGGFFGGGGDNDGDGGGFFNGGFGGDGRDAGGGGGFFGGGDAGGGGSFGGGDGGGGGSF